MSVKTNHYDPKRLFIKNNVIKIILLSHIIIIIFAIITYAVLTLEFYNEYSNILRKNQSSNIKISNTEELINTISFVHENIEIKKNNTYYFLSKNRDKLLKSNISSFSNLIIYNVDDTTTLHLPYYFSFKYDNNTYLNISFDHSNEAFVSLLVTIMLLVLFFNILYYQMLKRAMDNTNTSNISAQEYALAERTTSYLVSIMHHKLNTPIKVLKTKSRVLAKTIEESNIVDSIKTVAARNYTNIYDALENITLITSKLKSFQELSKNEKNIYKLFEIAKETIEILRDDVITIKIDNKISQFEIDKSFISSHEMTQIFINQIKFSIEQMGTSVSIRVFNSDENSLTILFSDNGNQLNDELVQQIKNKTSITNSTYISDEFMDLVLNLNILTNSGGGLRLISSNENGNVYEIRISTKKISL